MRSKDARGAGITLVELLVAMALMMILTGSIVFVFIQAQAIFATVDAKVQVYQNARIALDQIERDLANVVNTSDMEFFNEVNLGTSHYDPSKAATMDIPIVGKETFIDGRGAGRGAPYHYAFTMLEPEPYTTVDGRGPFRRDSIYFKTVSTVENQTQPVLVEYALEDRNKPLPKLVRRQWRVTGFDSTVDPPHVIVNQAKKNAKPESRDLCYYVVETQFSIFLENRRTGLGGGYYSASEACDPRPRAPARERPFPAEKNVLAPPRFWIMTYCRPQDPQKPNEPNVLVRDPPDGQLLKLKQDSGGPMFPMLKAGDRIFIAEIGGATAKDFTIKRIHDNWNMSGTSRLELTEDLPTGKPRAPGLLPEYIYRAPWLPAAVRCTLKIKDAKGRELRTISRTFKVIAT